MRASGQTKKQNTQGRIVELTGIVKSASMDKTITVVVDRRVKHDLYKKFMTRSSKYYAHDEKNDAKAGDQVRIRQVRPMSKLKRWRLMEILVRAKQLGGDSGSESDKGQGDQ